MNAFCASENCDAFIVFRSFPSQENAPENSNQKRSSLKGSDQVQIKVQISSDQVGTTPAAADVDLGFAIHRPV
ncbi:hypothetical protein CFBP5877_15650 [Agrobacterium tumefaciens]|uniref:Uncharacterized protein n=1 Tax=Agrobacterium tumefaciens TaxID=358 RepID=A0AAE6BF83_AGRTU|nr:hypothetical protein CFBP5499_16115 [Agrobacterium tumefaciens]QCL80611.1 hypothetical protein CFBP5877_15650 [Agrobacterium tumefaciens]